MALAKRSLVKDGTAIDCSAQKHIDDIENKRKKRPCDDAYKYDDKSFLPQKKRIHGPPQSSQLPQPPPPSSSASIPLAQQSLSGARMQLRQSSDEQDDETLIRETQAALKSLSGNWPGGSLYKHEINDENPTFQNLFEEQKNNAARKMSPTISTTTAATAADPFYNGHYDGGGKDDYIFRDYHQSGGGSNKARSDLKSLQKFRRIDKDDRHSKDKGSHVIVSNYQPHDFTELVDDSSSELHTDGGGDPSKDDSGMHRPVAYSNSYMMAKSNDTYVAYPRSTAPFSQSSAFKPLTDSRRGYGGQHHDGVYGYGPPPQHDMDETDKLRMQIKEEDSTTKSMDSPDSKHYTILQPAGVDSKAASVLQDIAREGVVSVAAVSSTSSPGCVTSTTPNDHNNNINNINSNKVAYVMDHRVMVPPFSPGSINRGKMYLKIYLVRVGHIYVGSSLNFKAYAGKSGYEFYGCKRICCQKRKLVYCGNFAKKKCYQ